MDPFITELLLSGRVHDLYTQGPEPGGTTRIAAVLRRFTDDSSNERARTEWSAGPIDQRRNGS